MSRRLARLNEQLKREISQVIRSAVRDPRVGRPTVTDVEVAPDLSTARVFVRPDAALTEGEQGSAKEARTSNRKDSAESARQGDLIAGLGTAAPFIRRELGKVLRIRRVPELRFQVDRTLEQALRIERILDEVRTEAPPPDASVPEAGPGREG